MQCSCRSSFQRIVAAFLLVCGTGQIWANQPPRPGEIEQLRQSGQLEQCLENGRLLGNDRFSPDLLERAKSKIETARLQAIGKTEAEIQRLAPAPAPPSGWKGLATTGTVKTLTILIDFKDTASKHPAALTPEKVATGIYGDGTGGFPLESLHNYYLRASEGKLNIQGNVLGWYTMPKNRQDYSPASDSPNAATIFAIVKEALQSPQFAGHDFSQYDNDGDGYIDAINIIWAGDPGDWDSFWWGYQWSFNGAGGSSTTRFGGKKLNHFTWLWLATRNDDTDYDPKVLTHETGHLLGLPDYYDCDSKQGLPGGVGGLDMMDADLGVGNRPNHNAFSRWLLDWISPDIASNAMGRWVMNASGDPATHDHKAVVFFPNASSIFSEFYIVENRESIGNDTDALPANGLLIWHVDARLDSSHSDYQYNNSNTAHKLLQLVQADGLGEIEKGFPTNAGDFYNQGETFGPTTTPNSNAYDGTRTGILVKDISAVGLSMTAYIGSETFTITATGTGGVISGTGTFLSNTRQAVSATPDIGYDFSSWTDRADNSTVSRSSIYAFTLKKDRDFLANFVRKDCVLEVSASPKEGGTVSSGGTFGVRSPQTVTASVNAGYRFLTWTQDGIPVSAWPYSYALTMDRDHQLVANFAPTTGSNILFSTGFEASESYHLSAPLTQQGWELSGIAGNGLTTSWDGLGSVGYLGGTGTTNAYLSKAVNIADVGTDIVKLSVNMEIEDSTNNKRDTFGWMVFNTEDNTPLCGLLFNNATKGIDYWLDGKRYATGKSFKSWLNWNLEISLDFGRLTWDATLQGTDRLGITLNRTVVVANKPLSTVLGPLNVGSFAAVRLLNDPKAAGNNYMTFDEYLVTREAGKGDPWDMLLDGTPAQATVLSAPSTKVKTHGPHSLSATDSIDWLSVSLKTGVEYWFSVTGGRGDLQCGIYATSGSCPMVAQNADPENAGGFSLRYLPATSGTYKLGLVTSSTTAHYTLQYGIVKPPANALITSAVAISANGGTLYGSNRGISAPALFQGPGDAAPSSIAKAGVWWKWTPKTAGRYTLSTAGSNFATQLFAYAGTKATTATPLLLADNSIEGDRTSRATLDIIPADITAKKTYWIAVAAKDTQGGDIVLSLQKN